MQHKETHRTIFYPKIQAGWSFHSLLPCPKRVNLPHLLPTGSCYVFEIILMHYVTDAF